MGIGGRLDLLPGATDLQGRGLQGQVPHLEKPPALLAACAPNQCGEPRLELRQCEGLDQIANHSAVPTARLKPLAFLGLFMLHLTHVTGALAAGDKAAGADVYHAECADCHSLKPGKNKKGPSFAGLIGRAAGSVADARYSEAMRASKIRWTPDRIDAYISHPKKVVPGSIDHHRLHNAQTRADLIAFLASDWAFIDAAWLAI